MPYLPSSSPHLDLNSYPPRDEAGATEARHVLYVSRLCRMLGGTGAFASCGGAVLAPTYRRPL